jgi:hypothetical protein
VIIYQATVEITAPPLALIKTLSFTSEEKRDEFVFLAKATDYLTVVGVGHATVMESVIDAIAECGKERALV